MKLSFLFNQIIEQLINNICAVFFLGPGIYNSFQKNESENGHFNSNQEIIEKI
jgi:hypothetical protein